MPAEGVDECGGWMGIDLGTTNCTAAVWDASLSRTKVLRLGYERLARPPPSDGRGIGGGGGKIVPSAVSFRRSVRRADDGATINAVVDGGGERGDSIARCRRLSATVGYAAIASQSPPDARVVGMTPRQVKELIISDPEFWNSLPFEYVVADDANGDDVEDDGRNGGGRHTSDVGDDSSFDVLGDAADTPGDMAYRSQQSDDDGEVREGIAIRIRPPNVDEHPPSDTIGDPSSDGLLVTPSRVTAILLRAIRVAALEYLTNSDRGSKIQAPGLTRGRTGVSPTRMGNCVIGVPAHYGHAQRTAETNDAVRFHVIATSGDRRLGGDDVDELLARCAWKRMHPPTSTAVGGGGVGSTTWKASEHRTLISECRRAKEELCGNTNDECDGGKFAGIAETRVTLGGKTITITRQDFDTAIQPLVDRAERVIEDALSALRSRHHTSSIIHEVVLVGGSTHIPTVRSMLRRRFPPPIPPELCTSISAETAVAQGLAIQAALISGLVPLWELRNAMMMDVLPHSIGVWVSAIDVKHGGDARKVAPFAKGQIIHPEVDGGEDEGYYVPILQKDAPLPAMGSAVFTLADARQSGVTVIAVEQIGPGNVFQCMGVFDFLLCRLKGEDNSNHDKVRQVKIGMTLQTSGEFTVSIYDENDQDHREKRRRYLKEKASRDGSDGNNLKDIERFYEEEENNPRCSGTEISLAIFCIISFALYVAARVAFRDSDISHLNNEL
ncbi:hypothetical protein ACHAXA_003515 [Cyclostephanos tholiformis]|uniref:Uncharacterized protein n=1 Tax=Cyclostephanos tholiformis TaxID=382380 RepID=A0ABD3SF96_9STRA